MEKHSDPRSLRSTRLLKMMDTRKGTRVQTHQKQMPSFGKRRPK